MSVLVLARLSPIAATLMTLVLLALWWPRLTASVPTAFDFWGAPYSTYTFPWPVAYAEWLVIEGFFVWYTPVLLGDRRRPFDAADHQRHVATPEQHMPAQLASTPQGYGDMPNLWLAIVLVAPWTMTLFVHYSLRIAAGLATKVPGTVVAFPYAMLAVVYLCVRVLAPPAPRFYRPGDGRFVDGSV